MATGWGMQLTRQIGEHLVAAKLGRMGYVATPFAGNVPMYDLLVADQRGYALPVQVKAINGAAWQFKAGAWLDIKILDGKQTVRGRKVLLNPDLLCVFVVVKQDERDEFYVFSLKELQAFMLRSYRLVLKYHKGARPKNPDSLHWAVGPEQLQKLGFRNNWQILEKAFSPQRRGGRRAGALSTRVRIRLAAS
jgi:hypothetical protein